MSESTRHKDEGLMEAADVAAYTRLSESFIRKRTADGTLPVVRIGRRTLYRRADVDAWIASQTETTEGVA
jgi:excisionase family DNA binding protein